MIELPYSISTANQQKSYIAATILASSIDNTVNCSFAVRARAASACVTDENPNTFKLKTSNHKKFSKELDLNRASTNLKKVLRNIDQELTQLNHSAFSKQKLSKILQHEVDFDNGSASSTVAVSKITSSMILSRTLAIKEWAAEHQVTREEAIEYFNTHKYSELVTLTFDNYGVTFNDVEQQLNLFFEEWKSVLEGYGYGAYADLLTIYIERHKCNVSKKWHVHFQLMCPHLAQAKDTLYDIVNHCWNETNGYNGFVKIGPKSLHKGQIPIFQAINYAIKKDRVLDGNMTYVLNKNARQIKVTPRVSRAIKIATIDVQLPVSEISNEVLLEITCAVGRTNKDELRLTELNQGRNSFKISCSDIKDYKPNTTRSMFSNVMNRAAKVLKTYQDKRDRMIKALERALTSKTSKVQEWLNQRVLIASKNLHFAIPIPYPDINPEVNQNLYVLDE